MTLLLDAQNDLNSVRAFLSQYSSSKTDQARLSRGYQIPPFIDTKPISTSGRQQVCSGKQIQI